MKKLLFVVLPLLMASSVWGRQGMTPAPLNIRTGDGTTSNYPYQFKVPNGSLTDGADGTMTLSFSTQTLTSLTVSTLTVNSGILVGGTRGTAGQVLISSATSSNPTWGWAGLVVQAVQCTVTASSATNTSALALSNLTCNITPKSASDSIRVTMSCEILAPASATATVIFTLYRNGANLLAAGGFTQVKTLNASSMRLPLGLPGYIDSPATTSQVTYALAFSTDGGTITLNDNSSTCVEILEELGS